MRSYITLTSLSIWHHTITYIVFLIIIRLLGRGPICFPVGMFSVHQLQSGFAMDDTGVVHLEAIYTWNILFHSLISQQVREVHEEKRRETGAEIGAVNDYIYDYAK